MTESQTPRRLVRLLHLEDNPRDAEIISHRLNQGGVSCDIVLVNSRERFHAALEQQAFDLILCDYNVPGYDGMSALKHVKEVQPAVPVIIISGTVGEDDAVHCLHSGATDYLLKQRLERLVPAVGRAVQEARERRSRARAEEELQQREQRLSSIYDAVADGLFYVAVEQDGGYRVVSVNGAFVGITSLDYSDVVGRRVDDVLPTESLRGVLDHYDLAIRERRIVRWEQTFQFARGPRTGDICVTPVFDAEGRCSHLVGSFSDVTDRRHLESQLRQSQKMESVGQLAGGIAHDFNNLLTVINGMAELALLELKEDDQSLQRDLGEILRAGERAAALTRQLLAFSRKQILQPQDIDLNVIVTEVGSLLRRLLGEDINLRIVPSDHPVTVTADPGQVEQVIANLAVNARDAMPGGGVLTIETRVVSIDEAFGRQQGFAVNAGPYAVLSMRDTGVGMDDATRRQMFEPFFTTKGPGRGTGLGLSTVYGIVKQSGGFICVESDVGQGSCFSVHLPLVASTSVVPRSSSHVELPSGTETVLVVEDVTGLRDLITRTLEGAGYTVLTAASGGDALQVLETYDAPVHLAITDVVMPGMSGRELAERLERDHPSTKILYMSGYTDDVVVRHGISHKGIGFISKPFGTGELRRRVREALDASPHSP